jgi:signal transduction histidine kinase
VTEVFGRYLLRTGGRSEELVGRTVAELFGLESEAAALDGACARALSGQPAQFEGTAGEAPVRHLSIALSPLHDAGGSVVGAVGLTRDISENRRVQEQLLLSDRMVSVGTLAAGVAHEINNPLAAVVVNLDYITRILGEARGGDETGGQRHLGILARLAEASEPLREARLAVDRVRQIVRDLKIFSRSSQGGEEKIVLVDVERVLDSSARMAWNEIRHRARLVKEYGNVPPVSGSESRLGQVFLNLLVNAAQAIREGQVDRNRITLTTRAEDGSVIVEVTDTGAGMAPEVLRKLFTPFFTTKPVGTGTGLGLSICHRIVSGMSGTVTVESLVGKGSTFRIKLPVGDLARQSAPATPVPAAAPARRRGHILVVDDEIFVANAVVRSLNREHDVAVVGRAAEALARIQAGEQFDVILCDLMMPEMTGMDLYAELRKSHGAQAERMVFMTGGAFTPRARSFLDSVPNQRLEKPFDAQHLLSLVGDRLR